MTYQNSNSYQRQAPTKKEPKIPCCAYGTIDNIGERETKVGPCVAISLLYTQSPNEKQRWLTASFFGSALIEKAKKFKAGDEVSISGGLTRYDKFIKENTYKTSFVINSAEDIRFSHKHIDKGLPQNQPRGSEQTKAPRPVEAHQQEEAPRFY